MASRLNAARLRTLTKPGTYGDGGGLYLQVRGPTQRSWIFRYKRSDKTRLMGLGSYPTVGLAEAREAALAARRLLAQGTDPLGQKRARRLAEAARVNMTFGEVAERYLAAHEASWRSQIHRAQWNASLHAYVLPIVGKRPVADIDTAVVMQIIEPLWHSKTETASRVRGRIEAILDYAKARGWREGENPARWRGHLDHLLPSKAKLQRVKHHAALPWREIGSFMEALADETSTSALALRFIVLTAARTGEVLGAPWSEIDLEHAVWTIPADRMKGEREHRVPLSEPALAILREMLPMRRGDGGFVFPGAKVGKPFSKMALPLVLQRMGRGELTVHGLRSTFRDWCAEATNYPRELAEAALAHALRDKTEAAYQRGDLLEKRRRLMAEWATFCSRPVATGAVVPLRAGG